MSKPIVVVTGITGKQGGATARHLLAGGKFEVHGLVRDPSADKSKAWESKGVKLVKGDLEDAASLEAAFKGAHGVYLVVNFWGIGADGEIRQGKNAIDAAKRAGVKHLVYASVGAADKKSGIPHFESKWETEQYLAASGLHYSIIRPVFFMENFLYPNTVKDGVFYQAMKPTDKLQIIATDDIGAFAALAFEKQDLLPNKAIEIAGDDLTMEEYAKLLGASKFQEIPCDKLDHEMKVMYQFFQDVGYGADLAECKKIYPNLTSLKTWADKHIHNKH
jgi:uncharacterized protein YbjT (DUF2867 family)